MDGYELHGHLSEQLFSAIVDYFANFPSSVGSVSEEIYSLQAVYFSYTCKGIEDQNARERFIQTVFHSLYGLP